MRAKTPFQKIVIVGLGLMGGSLAAACRKRFPASRITGISRSSGARKAALRHRWVHEATESVAEGVKDADLVVLCTPVDSFSGLLKIINREARPGTLITDVGSIKGQLLKEWGGTRSRKVVWIGAHPMAGSHERGIGAARSNLYDDQLIFLIRPFRKSEMPAYRKILGFWKAFSGKVVPLSARTHDRIVADISHVPHAAAACLILSTNHRALLYAASGYRDTTRVAASDPRIWTPIFKGNAREIVRGLKAYERSLTAFRKALEGQNCRVLTRQLLAASKRRLEI